MTTLQARTEHCSNEEIQINNNLFIVPKAKKEEFENNNLSTKFYSQNPGPREEDVKPQNYAEGE